jgi:hypothetical protein
MAVALLMGLVACAADDTQLLGDPDAKDSGNGTYLEMFIPVPGNAQASRAENEVESTENYDDGEEFEYKVNKAYLYFFDEDNVPVMLSNGKQYAEFDMTYVADGVGEQELPTGSALRTSSGYTSGVRQMDIRLHLNKTYYLYVLCNIPVTAHFSTLNEFLEQTQTGDYETQGMPMASRSYKGEICKEIVLTSEHTENNPLQLTVDVERALARINYTCGLANDIYSYNVYHGNVFTLYRSLDSDEMDINEALGTVYLQHAVVFNFHDDWYTFRHVGNIDSQNYGTTLSNDATRFGQINTKNPFVIDLHTKDKNRAASNARSLYTNWLCNISEWHPTWDNSEMLPASTMNIPRNEDGTLNFDGITVDWKKEVLAYIPENVMETTAQTYGQATGVIFRVQIYPETRSFYYPPKMFSLGDDVYFYNGYFFSSLKDIMSAHNIIGLTEDNMADYGVKYYKEGYGYYLYFIRHLDNGDNSTMGPMEFAIVRNNTYELKVAKIAWAPLQEDELPNFDPTTPVEDDPEGQNIRIITSVRPWVTREQSTDLQIDDEN